MLTDAHLQLLMSPRLLCDSLCFNWMAWMSNSLMACLLC